MKYFKLKNEIQLNKLWGSSLVRNSAGGFTVIPSPDIIT